MKKWVWVAACAALPAVAAAQEGNWGYFEPGDGTMQAGIAGDNGAQLILKCDKPGEDKVYAVIAVGTELAPAKGASEFESREVRLTYDGGSPDDDQWRFNDKFAMAMNDHNVRAMDRFGDKLAEAEKLDVILKPFRKAPVQLSFDVTGAKGAMERVYKTCGDEVPFG